jgi:hypothetical protein
MTLSSLRGVRASDVRAFLATALAVPAIHVSLRVFDFRRVQAWLERHPAEVEPTKAAEPDTSPVSASPAWPGGSSASRPASRRAQEPSPGSEPRPGPRSESGTTPMPTSRSALRPVSASASGPESGISEGFPRAWASAHERETIRDAVRALGRARRYGFFRGNCLSQSLALWWRLRRRGIATDLRLGATMAGGVLAAHAWVEHKGRVLNDTQDVSSRYAPLVPKSSAPSSSRLPAEDRP